VSVRRAEFPQDKDAVVAIWREFVAFPKTDLGYQGFEAEFAELPGKYAAPAGRVLLAEDAGAVVGCVAMRPVDTAICEMKRLYVRPAAQGRGLGRQLAEALIDEARRAGYREVRLDVLAEFKRARVLYASLGFTEAEPVSYNPVPGTAFLGLELG
jgi:putative acetyltransferase